MDCLALNKPTVEFIKFKFPIQQTIFNKNLKEVMSIFSYFNIIKSLKSPKELVKFIYFYYQNKKIKYQNNNFKSFLKSKNNCTFAANYIAKKIKSY
jgi:hypothetical protein